MMGIKIAKSARDIIKEYIQETFHPISSGNVKVSVDMENHKVVVFHSQLADMLYGKNTADHEKAITKILHENGFDLVCTLTMTKSAYFSISGERPKVMISLPMRGRNMKDVEAEMMRIYNESYRDKYNLINQIFNTGYGEVANLGHSIEMMGNADMVVFADGWENSRGCLLEKRICDIYEIDYEFVKERKHNKAYCMYPYAGRDKNSVNNAIDALVTLNPACKLYVHGYRTISAAIDPDGCSAIIDDKISAVEHAIKENIGNNGEFLNKPNTRSISAKYPIVDDGAIAIVNTPIAEIFYPLSEGMFHMTNAAGTFYFNQFVSKGKAGKGNKVYYVAKIADSISDNTNYPVFMSNTPFEDSGLYQFYGSFVVDKNHVDFKPFSWFGRYGRVSVYD